MKTIYPVHGHFLMWMPMVEQEVSDKHAEALIATGAFTDKPPPEATDNQTEDPADAGSLDSEE